MAEENTIFMNLMTNVHLNEAREDWDQCENEFDKIVYIIKNMHNMDKQSKAYRSGKFDEMFREAEINNLVAEDAVLYSQSRLRLQEMAYAVDYASNESFEKGKMEGIKKGREEGIKKGREEERMSVARNMQAKGYSLEEIRSITGISLDQPGQS